MSSDLEILVPQSGSGPGALVVHPWWGRNATVRDYGRALSELGFVVGLPDAFEGTVVTDRDDAQALIEKHWQAAPGRLTAAFERLAGHPGVRGPGPDRRRQGLSCGKRSRFRDDPAGVRI